ncbi:MAG TPA: methyltransferase [Vicinamibacterales bacterium]|nr:methyltransferase [Vicinamibacterales bacterium]
MTDVRRPIARYRVRIGFAAAAVALWLAAPTWRSLTLGAAVAVLGEALRVWASGHLEKGREVTASGPYRWMRHPLYVGSAIIGLGVAIASARAAVAVLIAVYLGVTIASAIRSEEAHLTEKFGEAYPAYRAGSGAEPQRRFSWRRAAANREYRAVAGLAAAFALLASKAC